MFARRLRTPAPDAGTLADEAAAAFRDLPPSDTSDASTPDYFVHTADGRTFRRPPPGA